jgi:hypothetical protein
MATWPRKVWLFVLFTSIVSLLGCILWFWRSSFSASFPATASAMASSLAALAALEVALRAQWRQDKDRKEERKKQDEDRKEERKEAELKLLETQRRLASTYATNIEMWLRRGELSAVRIVINQSLLSIRSIADRMEILLFAAESLEEPPQTMRQHVELERENLKLALAMPAIRGLASIPNIWATQFRREDMDLTGIGALTFLLGMSTVWTNLILMVQQLPAASDAVEFVSHNRSIDVKQYLGFKVSFLREFKGLFDEFLDRASSGADVFRKYTNATSLRGLPDVGSLIDRSQQVSLKIPELQQWISFGKAFGIMKATEKDYKQALADATEGPDKYLETLNALRESAQTSLDEIGQAERLSDTQLHSGGDVSSKPRKSRK